MRNSAQGDCSDLTWEKSSMNKYKFASPAAAAAFMTSLATLGTTRASKIEGTMYSAVTPSSATMSAIARAAATFIDMVTERARLSSRPRNMPGKTRTLLIWFA